MNRPFVVLPLALMVSLLGTVGQTLLKLSINRLPRGLGPLSTSIHLSCDWRFVLGVLITGTGTLTWLYLLSRADLSYATPFLGIGIVLITLSSALLLHEPVGVQRLAGAIVIAIGIFLVGRS
jgi:drug/metabolite transporter (DMT)-like permease